MQTKKIDDLEKYIERLERDNKHYEDVLSTLRTRCTEGAEKAFDRSCYDFIKIVPVNERMIPKSDVIEMCDYLLNTGRGKKKSLEWLKKKMGERNAANFAE